MEVPGDVVFVDGIQSMGVHNGVVRIRFIRLGTDGNPAASVELLVPLVQVKSIIEGLNKVAV